MTGFITQTSVLLLARKRLELIERLLTGKVRSAATVNDTERQVLFLAKQALAALRTPPVPDTRGPFAVGSFTPWLAGGVSMFANVGAVALDFPAEAAKRARGQDWLATTLTGGSADPLHQHVGNPSGRLLLRLAERLRADIMDGDGDEQEKAQAMAAMRAFAIGHASQLATRLVAAPYLDEVGDQPGRASPLREKPTAAAVRSLIEAAVDRGSFDVATPRRTFWQSWLPDADALPDRLFKAYAAAAEDVYGTGARVAGGKAFNDALAQANPPALSAGLLRDGYQAYRFRTQGIYGRNYGEWLGATIFMFLPYMLVLPFMALMPSGKDALRLPPPAGLNSERAWFEMLNLPLAFGTPAPLITTLQVMLGSAKLGAGPETIFALVNAIVGLVTAIAFFATLGVEVPAGLRWPLFFAAPLLADLVLMIFLVVRADGGEARRQLAFGAVMRLVMAFIFIVGYLSFLHFGIEGLGDDGADSGAFWGLLVLWLAMAFGAWLGFTAMLLRPDQGGPAAAPDPLITGTPQWLRLFDDTALRTATATATTDVPALYPGHLEPVLKLVWTGSGTLFIRPDRSALVFAFAADGSGSQQVVPAPLAPMTTSEFAALLSHAVAEPDGSFSGKLTVTRLPADEPLDAALPTGDVFANHGDAQAHAEDRSARASQFQPVPATGDGYTLFLAPRARQAIAAGQAGEVLLTPEQDSAVAPAPGRLLAIPATGSASVVGNADTRFMDTFRPGDVISVATAIPQFRAVVAVLDDQHLQVNLPLDQVDANTAYSRPARDRLADAGGGTSTIAAHASVMNRVVGQAGAFLERMFVPGDVIEALPPNGAPVERRTVVGVVAAALGAAGELQLDAAFSPAVPVAPAAGVAYRRPGLITENGFNFVASDPTALFGGRALLDRAADLATLLSLGVSSQLLTDTERAAVAGSQDNAHPAVTPADKVFRDWNLNHRRVNEWRMLVQGQAVREADTHPTANELGWSGLLVRWLDMAQRPAQNTHAQTRARPQDPSNRDLSSALAFLLNLPAPT